MQQILRKILNIPRCLTPAPTPAPPKIILAPDAQSGDGFGWSVSTNGENDIVGAPYNDEGVPIYIFSKNGSFEEKVITYDGTSADPLVTSTAISKNFVVVGAWSQFESVGGEEGEGAYIVPLNDSSAMVRVAPEEDEGFGRRVAIAGNIVAIGAHLAPNIDSETGSFSIGAVYFYATDGTFIEKVSSPDSSVAELEDRFGWSVAMTDDVIVVGAPGHNDFTGAAYVFNTEDREFVTKIVPLDGAEGAWFGGNVAVHGDTIVVGGTDMVLDAANYYANEFGRATYIYSLDGTLIQQIMASDFDADFIGFRVAVSENVVVTVGGVLPAGGEIDFKNLSVYLFTKEGEFIEKIDAPDDEAVMFGYDVSIEGNRLVVGAPAFPETGAAYLYLI